MKKLLLAGFLLTAGFASAPVMFANATQVSYNIPRQVQNAFAAFTASCEANNQLVTNVSWTRNGGGTYTATFVLVDMSVEDSYTDGSATFRANGTQIN